jgi:ectoine hydroxylase-related dioxygenase (phytanoyl-CoA dioxygenase family)
MHLVQADASVDEVVGLIKEDGYAVVERLFDDDWVSAARAELKKILETTPLGRNAFEGFATRRIYALYAKTRVFDAPALHPLVLGVLDGVLGQYQFSAPVGIEIGPGEVAQNLHRDDGVYPLPTEQLVSPPAATDGNRAARQRLTRCVSRRCRQDR